MQLFTMVRFSLRRLLRHTLLLGIGIGLPLLLGLLHVILHKNIPTWAFAIVFAIFAWGIVYIQRSVDKVSGFMDGLRNANVSDSGIAGAQVIVGAIIFAVQVAIFAGIALR